jgi:hypothetical protein
MAMRRRHGHLRACEIVLPTLVKLVLPKQKGGGLAVYHRAAVVANDQRSLELQPTAYPHPLTPATPCHPPHSVVVLSW